MGSGCPTNTGLGVSAWVGGWGARSGDPFQASLSRQPCGLRCLHFLTPQLRHCASDVAPTTLMLCVDQTSHVGPALLPACWCACARVLCNGVALFPTADFSHSAAQDVFGAAHAPVRGLRIADTAVGWGSAPCTRTEDVRAPRRRSGSWNRALGSGRCAERSGADPGVSVLP